ncbi:hypothetical protein FOA52_007385 [Chlamydomonas sp. UWO 241]|nr:hypothetical protein FOA52_007385 [Chlamydomonas sp. UWO 241]
MTPALAGMLQLWREWCVTFSKDPSNASGFFNFRANMRTVLEINRDSSVPFWGGANEFADLSFEDFIAAFTGALQPDDESRRGPRRSLLETAHLTGFGSGRGSGNNWALGGLALDSGDGVDWVAAGAVTSPKKQSTCGACSHFVAVSMIESALLMAGLGGGASSLDLSEQEMISCVTKDSSPYAGFHCGGGWIDLNINYARWRGLNKESLWPYTNSDGVCDRLTDPFSGNAVKLASGAVRVSPQESEQALKNAVLTGPVGVLIKADARLMNYRGGVYTPGSGCSGPVDHAVVVVGFGFDAPSGLWYWTIKNSWGTAWGEGGYARLAMTGDGDGPCGIYKWAYSLSGTQFVNAALASPYN